jgi:hypothetical protein
MRITLIEVLSMYEHIVSNITENLFQDGSDPSYAADGIKQGTTL